MCGKNNLPTELECLEAEDLCVAKELLSDYYYVYKNWLNNYSSNDAKDAGEVVCKKYEIPANISSESITRGGQADKIYKIMLKK